MDERTLTLEQIMAYGGYLRTEERAPGTIEKYLRDARSFAVWLDGAPVTSVWLRGLECWCGEQLYFR